MLITTKTIITFDPIKERSAIKAFEEQADIEKWRITDSTTGITYMLSDTYHIDTAERSEE